MYQIIKDNARFTVMTDGVIRMEYSANACFADEETFFALRKAKCNADITECGDGVVIKTKKMTLTYKSGEFSSDSLFAEINTAGVNTVWHFGDENKENLGGTLTTVDEVEGGFTKDGRLYARYKIDTEYEHAEPVPEGLLALDGWHVIDDSGKALFTEDWAKSRDDAHKYDLYLFAYGHDFKAALRDLAAVSGKMVMPRKYYMGAWYSRWRRYSAKEFLEIVDGYEQNDFPLDVLVVDTDWHYQDWADGEGYPKAKYGYGHATNLGWTGYSWDRFIFPDPQGFIDAVHSRGVAMTISDHPADGIRDHEDTYPEFMAELEMAGYTEEVPDVPKYISKTEKENYGRGVKNFRYNAGSKAYMDAYFKTTMDKLNDMGVDFWWLDWQQDYLYPEVHGIKGLTHLEWLNYLYYNHFRREGQRGQGFSRWAGWGDQKHPGAFSGDITTSWECLDFEIRMTVSSGNAGCFWWTHDIGGFLDKIGRQSEIYSRWVQFGALSAALRTHSCGDVGGIETDRRPWFWPEPFRSAMRDTFKLRSRLMPYLYSMAYIGERDSIPMIRPLYLELPENANAYKYKDTYKFGDSVFVAPIHEAGTGDNYEVTRSFWLPDGQWYHWFTGKRFDSGEDSVTCDLDSFPLFVKAGDPVVTQPYSKRMTSAKVTSPIVKIYAGLGDLSGKGLLYEDDGQTEVEVTGAFRLTDIYYDKVGNTHTVKFVPSGKGFDGAPETRDITVEIIDTDELTCTSAGNLSYDKDTRTAVVTVSGVEADKEFTLTVKGSV